MLLESIARTFVQRCSIRTATTHERCHEILQQGAFDLVVVSEKLADGPGLPLLWRIARDSPDTRRVFSATRPHLQFCKGKLGACGLFRTLTYPIRPREFLATLMLADPRLDTDDATFGTHRVRHVRLVAREVRVERPGSLRDRRAVGLPRHPEQSRNAPPRRSATRLPAAAARIPAADLKLSATNTYAPAARAPQKVLLGIVTLAVFVATTLILQLPAMNESAPTEQRLTTGLIRSMPIFRPPAMAARRREARPATEPIRVRPVSQHSDTTGVPMADPSTFGSEAYEIIYEN